MTLDPKLNFKLCYLLNCNGLSSRDVAFLCNVTESYISHIKHGAPCSANMIAKIDSLIEALEKYSKEHKQIPLFFLLVNETQKQAAIRKKEVIQQFKQDYDLIS